MEGCIQGAGRPAHKLQGGETKPGVCGQAAAWKWVVVPVNTVWGADALTGSEIVCTANGPSTRKLHRHLSPMPPEA